MRSSVAYHPQFRMFALYRNLKFYPSGLPKFWESDHKDSFGCPFMSCVFSGFCKDCDYVLRDKNSL